MVNLTKTKTNVNNIYLRKALTYKYFWYKFESTCEGEDEQWRLRTWERRWIFCLNFCWHTSQTNFGSWPHSYVRWRVKVCFFLYIFPHFGQRNVIDNELSCPLVTSMFSCNIVDTNWAISEKQTMRILIYIVLVIIDIQTVLLQNIYAFQVVWIWFRYINCIAPIFICCDNCWFFL